MREGTHGTEDPHCSETPTGCLPWALALPGMARHKQTPPPLPPAAQNQAPLAPSPWKKSWAQLRGPDGQVMKGALVNSAKQPCLGGGGQ